VLLVAHLCRASCLLAVSALLPLTSCGSDGSDEVRTILVPDDEPTIAEAVAAARPGDLVLIGPGTYHESVDVETERVTIRGLDRNTVVLDGEDRLGNGIEVVANGVSVENLTVRRYTQNGLLFNGAYREDGETIEGTPGEGDAALVGFRASYITAASNGLYGIYAFAARDGTIEHSYASGHPDSGIYVGQCRPCNVVVTDVVAEHNAIGYYGTNASGGVFVINSVFRQNRLGMTPNSQDMELLAPQSETVVAGNLVVDNDDPATPAIPGGFFGTGIAVGGGTRNTIVRNRVIDHTGAGIVLLTLNPYDPEANRVEGNTLESNGVDLVFGPATPDARGNCFTANVFSTSSPPDVEALLPCGAADGPSGSVPGASPYSGPAAPPGVDYRTMALPPAQPSMPDPATAGVRAVGPPPPVDLASIDVPAA
jgi:nitrous oxidase accessory protein NosD